MIEIRFYGKLRRHAPESRSDRESVLRVEPRPGESVGTLLERLGLLPEELSHVFLNGALLSTRNSMAPWLRYRQVGQRGLDTPVRDGDRLGLFGRDIALLVV